MLELSVSNVSVEISIEMQIYRNYLIFFFFLYKNILVKYLK